MDTINGIPALADTDPASLIGQYSRDLRDALNDGTGGWVNFFSTIAGITTVRARYVRIGDVVFAEGEFSGSFTSGATVVANNDTFPAGVRPDVITFAPAYMSGGFPGIAYIGANGSLSIAHQASTRTSFQFNASWYRP